MTTDDQGPSTGWEPSVPAGDTLLRAAVLSLADRIVELGRRGGRPVLSDGGIAGALMAERGSFANIIVVTHPPADWGDVRSSIDLLLPRECPGMVMSPFPTPDLSGFGYHLVGHPPLMIRPPSDAPAPAIEGLDVVEVTDADTVAVFDRTLIEGYPMPDIDLGYFTPDMLGGNTHLFVGLVGGEPVAVASGHLAHGVQHVEFVATRAEHRGHGYGAAVTWAASTIDPSRPAVLLASDDGRPVYARLGYLPIMRWTLWLRPPR